MKRRRTELEGKRPATVEHLARIRKPTKKEPVLATDVVYLVHLDPQVRQVNQANLVSPARLACLEHLVSHQRHHAKLSRRLHANRVHLDHLVHLVHPVHLEIPEIKEHLVVQVLMLLPDHPDPLAHLVHQVQLVPMDHPVMPVLLLKANQLRPANPEMLAMLVHQVHPVQLAIQAKTAMLVNQVPKVPKAHPDPQVQMVNQVHPAHQAHQVLQEKRVFVRNIAPWTAVCSSKMEREDKRQHSIIDIISKGIFFEWTINIGLYLFFHYQFLRKLNFSEQKKITFLPFAVNLNRTLPNSLCLPIFHACFVFV